MDKALLIAISGGIPTRTYADTGTLALGCSRSGHVRCQNTAPKCRRLQNARLQHKSVCAFFRLWGENGGHMSIKKIAQMTGASVSTVSRVLNNPDYKCQDSKLRDRIWKAAVEINYVPKGFEDITEGDGAFIRPEAVNVTRADERLQYQATAETAVVTDVTFKGNIIELKLWLHGNTITAYRQTNQTLVAPGDKVKVFIDRMFVKEGDRTYTQVNGIYRNVESVVI